MHVTIRSHPTNQPISNRRQLDIPVQVFLAPMKDNYRKPETGMWTFLLQRCNGGLPAGEERELGGDGYR